MKVEKLDKRSFRITFQESTGNKVIHYETRSEDNTAEIIAKLKFLTRMKDPHERPVR